MEEKQNHKEKTYISSKEVEGRIPLDESPTKVYIMNHIIEMTIMEKRRKRGCAIRKINKDYYLVESTGEIKKFGERDKNQVKKINMNAKYSALKRAINYNFHGNKSEVHVILTYEKGMFDRDKASADFKAFWKHLRFYNEFLEYIVIYEPTEKGSWHMHVLIKDTRGRYLCISKTDIQTIWKNGFVYITRIRNNDNIGAYFVALVSFDKDSSECKGKAKRLHYYKKGFRLYSRSKGISDPPCIETTYLEAKKLVEGLEPCYEQNYGIFSTDDDRELNVVYKKEYNKKRPMGIYEK